MTRAKVFQIGLLFFLLGGFGYEVFQFLGLESISAGIATQSILILIIFAWTASYLFRVFSGNMTFMEQRKRYREAYEKLTDEKILQKFEAMTEGEKIELLKAVQRSALCRSRRELSNAYLLAKIGVDTAENEPLEVWGKIFNIIHWCP